MMKWIFGIIITIFILMVVALSILVSTSAGLSVSLQLAKHFIPGKLNYSTVYETQKGAVTVVQLDYYYRGVVEISIDKLHLDWHPIALLRGTLYITHLNAENIKIILLPSPEKKNKKEKINLLHQRFPLSLEIKEGYLENISIDQKTETRPVLVRNLRLKQINISRSLASTIDAEIIQPFIINLHLSSTGTRDNYRFFLTAKKNSDLNWLIDGKGTRQWVELKMHEAHTLDGHLNAFMKINFEPLLQWQINTDIAHLNLRRFYKKWPRKLTFQLNTTGCCKTNQFFNFTVSGLLQTPKAYFHITGQHAQAWDLNWSADIGDFSSLLTTASGTLKGFGSITGPTQSPLITGDLSGKNIKLFNCYVATLKSRWCFDTSFNQDSKARFNFHQLTTPCFQLSRLEINASGESHTHQISMEALIDDKKSGKIALNSLLHENFEDKIWCGTFTRFNIYSEKFGKWSINQPAIVIIDSNHTTLFPLCLHSRNGRLCLCGEWGQRSFPVADVKITINSVDLAFFRTILSNIIQPHGCLKSNFNIRGALKKPALTNILELKQGHIECPIVKAASIRIQASVNTTSSRINYRFYGYSQNQPVQIVGHTRLDVPGYPTTFTFQGKNILLMNTRQYVIYGTANLRIDILGRNINIAGILTIPKATLKPTTFNRSTTITQDVVYVGPEAQKRSPWKTHMNIKIMLGDQIVLNSLGVKGRFTGELTLLKIPTQPLIANGRIIIVDGTFTTHGRTLDIAPHSSVSFIRNPINNPLLNVRAIRTLKSLPVSPEIGNQIITVGLDIEGTLHHPEIGLYASDPNLTQADISSYLIFGHPVNANTPDNVNLLVDAIDTLNIFGNQKSMRSIIDQITQGLGLTELGIESRTTALALSTPNNHTQSAFVVGRYLSPHIYIRYSRGITIPINIVQLRYLISKNWSIQTEASSEGSGGDVLYTL